MKNLIINYTFNAAGKTITFTDFASIDKEKILLITNVTTGGIIYNFSKSDMRGTVAGNVLTLAASTSGMNNSDDLMIFYQEQDTPMIVNGSVLNNNTANLLIPSMDTSLFPYVCLHLLTIGSGSPTFLFEGSNDNSTWQNINLQGAASTNAAISATAANTVFAGVCPTRYFRVRVSVVGSGGANATAVAVFRAIPLPNIPISTVTANQSGAWAVSVSSVTPGTGATGLGKAEDAAAANGDTGIFSLSVRRDTLGDRTSADGDYSEGTVTRHGAMLVKNFERHARSYLASGKVAWASGNPTDIFTIFGSASSNIYITRLEITAYQQTAGLLEFGFIKRSATNTGGTSTSITAVPAESTDAAANATLLQYTAVPSGLGTTVGTLKRMFVPVDAATSTNSRMMEIDFAKLGKPIALIGTAQGLAVNLNAVAVTALTVDFNIEWYEI